MRRSWILVWCPPREVRRPQGSGRRRAGNRETLGAGIFVTSPGCTWWAVASGFGPALRRRGAAAARGRRHRIPALRPGAEARGAGRVRRGPAAPGHPRRTRWHRRIGASAWSRSAIESVSVCGAADRTEADRSQPEWEAPGLRAAARSEFGKVRVPALVECGTRAVVHAALGAVRQRAETRPAVRSQPCRWACCGWRTGAFPDLHRDSQSRRRAPTGCGRSRSPAAGALGPGSPLPRPDKGCARYRRGDSQAGAVRAGGGNR